MDDIYSNYEEEIDSLINDFNTEFVDRTAFDNSESDISEALMQKKDDSNDSNFIQTAKPIETVVNIAKPDSQSENDGDDVPVSNLEAKKYLILKWNRR